MSIFKSALREPKSQPLRGATGVAAVNSVDFIKKVFALQAEGKAVAAYRNAAERARLAAEGVANFVEPEMMTGWAKLVFKPSNEDEIAQYVSTSGTTGAAKLIALSHRNIADVCRRLNAAMECDATIREYVGVPVTYSFGLGRARAVSAAGGAFYIPPNGFSPSEFAGMLKRGEVNALSAVPTLLRILFENADFFGDEKAALKWIEIGSQPMSIQEKERIKALFPNAVILQHYGLTEASRTTMLRIDRESGKPLASVGIATPPAETRISADGRIMIRGPHVARFELTEKGLKPLVDDEGWLTTNDLGVIENGYLKFLGRADDLINCGGVKFTCDALERAISQSLAALPGTIAVARMPDILRGDGILVGYRKDISTSEHALRDAAIDAVSKFGVKAGGAVRLLAVDVLPTTDTGKVRRAELVRLYDDHTHEAVHSESTPLELKILEVWRAALGGRTIGVSDSFFDVGGDVADAEIIIERMEEAGIPDEVGRRMLDGLTIHDLARAVSSAGHEEKDDFEAQVLSIWRQALGRDEVDLDESFYDVGGDSLSAVTVALSLERAGLPPEIAHGVFDGKTVRQLTEAMREIAKPQLQQAAARPAPATKSGTAIFSEASNFMKGVALLCMIGSHWIPPYLIATNHDGGMISKFLALFFSLGTPTLAFMFGLGVTVFYRRQYEKSRPAFYRNVAVAVGLLSVAIFADFLTELLVWFSEGRAQGIMIVALEAYSPFMYFALATASLPLWIGRVSGTMRSAYVLLAAAGAFYLTHLELKSVLDANSNDAESIFWMRYLAGRWSFFLLGSVSLVGAAIGVFVKRRLDASRGLSLFRPIGILMIIGALLLSLATGQEKIWFTFPKEISALTLMFYSGIALTVIAAFFPLSRRAGKFIPARRAIEIVCSLGALLFPLYMLQSVVFRAAESFGIVTGTPFLVALTGFIIAFAAIVTLLTRRVYILLYAGRH